MSFDMSFDMSSDFLTMVCSPSFSNQKLYEFLEQASNGEIENLSGVGGCGVFSMFNYLYQAHMFVIEDHKLTIQPRGLQVWVEKSENDYELKSHYLSITHGIDFHMKRDSLHVSVDAGRNYYYLESSLDYDQFLLILDGIEDGYVKLNKVSRARGFAHARTYCDRGLYPGHYLFLTALEFSNLDTCCKLFRDAMWKTDLIEFGMDHFSYELISGLFKRNPDPEVRTYFEKLIRPGMMITTLRDQDGNCRVCVVRRNGKDVKPCDIILEIHPKPKVRLVSTLPIFTPMMNDDD